MPPSTVSRHRGPALALLASMAACEATTVARVDADEPPEVGVPEASAPVWPEPPLIAPKPPISPGILNCAPIFIDPDGICRPRIEACTTDELAIPSRGCVTPVRVAAEVPPGAAVFEVFSDDEVAAGLGPGLAEVIATAPAGSVLQLREGRFRGDVVIDKALIVQGRGVGLTVVEGTVAAPGVVQVKNAVVRMLDMNIDGPADGVHVQDGGELALDRVFLSAGLAFVATRGALTARDCRVVQAGGHSLALVGGTVTLVGVALPAGLTHPITVSLLSPGSRLTALDVIIEGSTGIGGYSSASLEFFGSRISSASIAGCNLSLDQSVIGRFHNDGAPTTTNIRASRLEGGFRAGPNTLVEESIVTGSVNPLAVSPNVIELSTDSELRSVEIKGGDGDGIVVRVEAPTVDGVTLRDVSIIRTAASSMRPGVGIRVSGPTHLTMNQVSIENVANIGILATGLASIQATHLHIDGGPADDAHPYRFGIVANTGATLLLRDSVITRSIGLGVWLKDGTSTLDADGLWIDGVVPGLIEDVDQGTIEGVADGLLVTVGATATVKRLAVRDIDRVSLHSAAGHGSLSTGHFTRCDLGFVTTGSVEEWTLEGLENECDTPTYSDSVLVVPRRVRL